MEARAITARGSRVRGSAATMPDASTPEAPVADVLAEIARLTVETPGGEAFLRLLAGRLAAVGDESTRERQVLDAMLPAPAVLSDAATTQLRWNAKARANALAEFGALTAAGLEELRGVRTGNPHATSGRWLRDRRVFAVSGTNGRLFPAFQFDGGEPRPVIARILGTLGDELVGWEVLAWFTGSSGYLDGARPVDRLAEDPDGVVAAAAHQAALSAD